MANDRNRGPGMPMLTAEQGSDDYLIDYSYDQWRHAQMRQLEQSYADLSEANIPFSQSGEARRRAAA